MGEIQQMLSEKIGHEFVCIVLPQFRHHIVVDNAVFAKIPSLEHRSLPSCSEYLC